MAVKSLMNGQLVKITGKYLVFDNYILGNGVIYKPPQGGEIVEATYLKNGIISYATVLQNKCYIFLNDKLIYEVKDLLNLPCLMKDKQGLYIRLSYGWFNVIYICFNLQGVKLWEWCIRPCKNIVFIHYIKKVSKIIREKFYYPVKGYATSSGSYGISYGVMEKNKVVLVSIVNGKKYYFSKIVCGNDIIRIWRYDTKQFIIVK